MKNQEFLGGIESLIMSTKKSRDFLNRTEANLAARRKTS
jgi:hypothetical protein